MPSRPVNPKTPAVQELLAAGLSNQTIAAQLGMCRRTIARIRRQHDIPNTRYPFAVRHRDEQPDDAAVQRIVHGLQPYPTLTAAEAREAARQLTRRGASAAEIARRTGAAPRTIHRWRAADRTAA